MNHVIIDKINGVIFITLEPPSPIEVEFKELPLPSLPAPVPLVEKQEPILVQKPYAYRDYPKPDEKLLAQGGYINTTQASAILGTTLNNMDYLAAQKRIPAYREEGSKWVLFLLDDVITYLKNRKLPQ